MISNSLLEKENYNPSYADLNISFEELQINPIEDKILYEERQKLSKPPEESLTNREKNAHLTYDQKLFIYSQYQYQGKRISHICQTFGVSTSTVKRIIRQFRTNIKRINIYHEIIWKKLISSPAVVDWISEFVKITTGSLTSEDVRIYIKRKLSVLIPVHQIRKHLKTNEYLSFKNGSSRPLFLNTKKQELKKQLFWVLLARQLGEIRILPYSALSSPPLNDRHFAKLGGGTRQRWFLFSQIYIKKFEKHLVNQIF